ncbi:uncharacterized protein TNCV_3441471 [Trichonephila clavipes]|uniref:Uncharacterized protein n=1 Tax=Trichonephila clavipes TaxID=2585209 RepID=A0A8X6W641_TRICX|nr:uncharacterized protein TNCV_3441471 [Trichonephila clavipes]
MADSDDIQVIKFRVHRSEFCSPDDFSSEESDDEDDTIVVRSVTHGNDGDLLEFEAQFDKKAFKQTFRVPKDFDGNIADLEVRNQENGSRAFGAIFKHLNQELAPPGKRAWHLKDKFKEQEKKHSKGIYYDAQYL